VYGEKDIDCVLRGGDSDSSMLEFDLRPLRRKPINPFKLRLSDSAISLPLNEKLVGGPGSWVKLSRFEPEDRRPFTEVAEDEDAAP